MNDLRFCLEGKIKNISRIVVLFILLPILLHSISIIDSLESELQEVSSDHEKLQIYITLVKNSKNGSLDESESYLKNAQELSDKIDDPKLAIEIRLLWGNLYVHQGEYLKAYKIFQDCLSISSTLKYEKCKIKCLLSIASFHYSISEYIKSNEICEKILSLDHDSISHSIGQVYFQIGNNYRKLGSKHDALENFQKSLEIHKISNTDREYASVLIYVGKTYLDLEEFDTAIKTSSKALEMSKAIGDQWTMGLACNDLAWAYSQKGDFDKALDYNELAMKFRKSVNAKYAVTSSMLNIGILYKDFNEPDKAIYYLTNALDNTKNSKYFIVNHDKERCYENLSQLYLQKKDYLNTIKYLNLKSMISDSLDNAVKHNEIARIEAKFHIKNFEETQLTQKKLQNQKTLLIAFIIFSLAVIIILIIYNKYSHKMFQNKLLLKEIEDRKINEEALNSQNEKYELINRILRHDMANGLSIIQSGLGLYFTDKDDEMLKQIYIKNKSLIRLIKDVGSSTTFMMEHHDLQIFKLSDIYNQIKTKYKLEIILINSCSFFAIPTINSVFDNILENAVSHGEATKIEIDSKVIGSNCEIRIANNGKNIPPKILSRIFNKGFKHGAAANTGMGLYIVKDVMKQCDGSVEVINSETQGAVFILTFRKVIQKL